MNKRFFLLYALSAITLVGMDKDLGCGSSAVADSSSPMVISSTPRSIQKPSASRLRADSIGSVAMNLSENYSDFKDSPMNASDFTDSGASHEVSSTPATPDLMLLATDGPNRTPLVNIQHGLSKTTPSSEDVRELSRNLGLLKETPGGSSNTIVQAAASHARKSLTRAVSRKSLTRAVSSFGSPIGVMELGTPRFKENQELLNALKSSEHLFKYEGDLLKVAVAAAPSPLQRKRRAIQVIHARDVHDLDAYKREDLRDHGFLSHDGDTLIVGLQKDKVTKKNPIDFKSVRGSFHHEYILEQYGISTKLATDDDCGEFFQGSDGKFFGAFRDRNDHLVVNTVFPAFVIHNKKTDEVVRLLSLVRLRPDKTFEHMRDLNVSRDEFQDMLNQAKPFTQAPGAPGILAEISKQFAQKFILPLESDGSENQLRNILKTKRVPGIYVYTPND